MIDAAAEEFGVRMAGPFAGQKMSERIDAVALYKPADDLPEVFPAFKHIFVVLDEDGHVGWKPFDEATVGELLRAHQAGLEGDPRRPYLWPIVPQGDFTLVLASWDVLLRGLDIAYKAAEVMATTFGASEFLTRVIPRLRRSSDIPAEKLSKREADPERITELLNRRPFTMPELAKLFAITDEEAIALGSTLGLEAGEDGLWSAGKDDDAAFVRRLIKFLLQNAESWPSREEAMPEFVNARLAAQIEEQPEGFVAWQYGWFGRPGDGEDGEYRYPEAEHEFGYEVVVVPYSEGVDVAELERLLNEGTPSHEESHLAAVLPDQRLTDGSRAHLFIVLRVNPSR